MTFDLLTAKHPEQVKTLRGAFDAWSDQMADPISGSSKRWKDAPAEQLTDRQKKRLEKRRQRKKKQGAREKEKEARLQETPGKKPGVTKRDSSE